MPVYIAPPEKYNGINGIENIPILDPARDRGPIRCRCPCDPEDVGFAGPPGRRSGKAKTYQERAAMAVVTVPWKAVAGGEDIDQGRSEDSSVMTT
jgi:hypothetical protein